MDRAPGLSVRLKLTLSYAGFLMLAGAVLLAAGYFSLSRGVHPGVIFIVRSHADLLRGFAPIAAVVMAFLLVFGLLGGWFLAGRMLAPLTSITDATRIAATGSLAHRIRLPGRRDEFRELADAFDAMLARLEAQVAEQQRFAANASHELRTPLAITQTLLDVARNDPNRDKRRARRTPPRRQHPGDRPHRGTAPAQPRRPALLRRGTRRPVPRRRRSRRDAPARRRSTRSHRRDLRRRDPHHRIARTPAADEHEPRAQRHRPQPARTGHRVGHDQRSPRERGAHRREHRREAHPATGRHARRAVSARLQAHPHRPRRGRPRPGDRREHHPSTRRNPHAHPPGRRGALRHRATTAAQR